MNNNGNNHNLSGIVKSVRDIMRKDAGVDGDAQRISQMVWMIFLKVFDTMEEEREDLKFKQSCWKISKEEIIKRNYNLDVNNPTKPEAEKELSKEEIIERIEQNLNRTREILG